MADHDEDGNVGDQNERTIIDDINHDVDPADPRSLIYVFSEKFQPNSHRISAFITSQIKLSVCAEGYCWKRVTEAQREWYWDQFVAAFKWSPLYDARVRSAWNTTSASLYRKTVHSWRISDTKPNCVAADVWATWKDIWATEAWQSRSGIYKRNRQSEPEGPGTGITKHTAGSRSFVDHNNLLRDEFGREPNSYELFHKTHTNKGGDFVDERSRAFSLEFEAQRASVSSDSDGVNSYRRALTAAEINKLYLDVAGGVKKWGTVYGLGTQASSIYPRETARGSGSGSGSRSRGTAATMKAGLDAATYAAESAIEEARDANEKARAADEKARAADEKAQRYESEIENLRSRTNSLEETVRALIAQLGSKKKKNAPDRLKEASSSRLNAFKPFTHVSGTFGDNDDEGDEFQWLDNEDDTDETQSP